MTPTFTDLRLSEPILRALDARDYHTPTPIQVQAIPHLLAGRDLLGVAQTGTGKTAAFALPMLQILDQRRRRPQPRAPHALVLTPTRELAAQIAESFRSYGQRLRLRHTVVYGGVGQAPQVRALRAGVDILVATPGRLLDLLDQGHVDLRDVSIFVLDEADRMLDMGFIRDVRRVIAELPDERQSLLFSATMPDDIVKLAGKILYDPVRVEVTPPASTVERIDQTVLFVEKSDKRALLGEVLADRSIERVLVFTRTKHGADRVVKHLRQIEGGAAAIHGDKSQGARERALRGFREGRIRVLVATDIAARGIDVPEITHVINFDLPNIAESYVHRIGRTARAGRAGQAISFCDEGEREYLRAIERLIRRAVTVVEDHPYASTVPFPMRDTRPARGPQRPPQRQGTTRRGGGRKARNGQRARTASSRR